MGMRKRLVVPAWIGLLLIVSGFLAFVASFFLLPLYVTTLNCFDSCSPPLYATTWEFSLRELSDLTSLRVTPIFDVVALLLLYLPLLMAAVVVGCGIGFLIRPRRAFAIWSHRAWLTGGIALLLWLLFFLVFIFGLRPETGYLGMLVGYALFWGGNRVFLAAQPEARSDP